MDMIQDFKASDEIAFTSISDFPIDQLTTDLKDTRETVTISVTKVKDSLQYEDATTLPSLAEYKSAAKEERVQREMSKTTTLFITVAWMILPMYCFFPPLSRSNVV